MKSQQVTLAQLYAVQAMIYEHGNTILLFPGNLASNNHHKIIIGMLPLYFRKARVHYNTEVDIALLFHAIYIIMCTPSPCRCDCSSRVNWGEPERAPHSRDLHHFFMYVLPACRRLASRARRFFTGGSGRGEVREKYAW